MTCISIASLQRAQSETGLFVVHFNKKIISFIAKWMTISTETCGQKIDLTSVTLSN